MLEVIRTIKLSYSVNSKNINLYLSNTLYILTGGVNLIPISKLWAKGIELQFVKDNIAITINGTTFKALLYYGLYALNI
jgi:hypothetical protein